VAELQAGREGVVWIREMLPRPELMQLLTAAEVFICPSIYEPQGIVNLEAMACETAVVATATGGIPEVVVHGETGLLVPIEQAKDGTGTPLDPDRYVADFAAALVSVVTDPDRAAEMGRAGRRRAISSFSWSTIAERTRAIYASLV
jgi:starch synthase